jgi:hypothetical protein
METRWKVPVLTQIILILIEYINLSPRFYSRDTLAYALANYVSGLSYIGPFNPRGNVS